MHGPYFKVQWFCLISWRLFDVWTSYFVIMSQSDPTCDLKINVTVTYISWSSDFALYLEDSLMYVHHTSGLWVSMTRCLTSKHVGHCDLYFMVQWFCLISWKLFSGWTSYFWSLWMSCFWKMSRCSTTFDLKINLGHSDLHFMVQWFFSFYFLLWKHFSFIGNAQFRRAMLSGKQLLFIEHNYSLNFLNKVSQCGWPEPN